MDALGVGLNLETMLHVTYSTPNLNFQCPCNDSRVIMEVPSSTFSPDPFLDSTQGVPGYTTRIPPSVSWDSANYSSWCVCVAHGACVWLMVRVCVAHGACVWLMVRVCGSWCVCVWLMVRVCGSGEVGRGAGGGQGGAWGETIGKAPLCFPCTRRARVRV